MLTFIQQPKDFTPITQGVLFTIESDSVSDMFIEIFDTQNHSLIGSKVVKGRKSAVIDIAPYVAALITPTTSQSTTCSIDQAPAKMFHIEVSTADSFIESRIVTLSDNSEYPQQTVHTTMPLERTISLGECDDIRLYTDKQCTIAAQIVASPGQVISLESVSQSGAANIHLATDSFSSNTEMIYIDIYCNDTLEKTLRYKVVPKFKNAVRIAWRSPIGSIERFTFPILKRKSYTVDKSIARNSNSESQIISCHGATLLIVQSGSVKQSLAEALAQAILATNVWIETDTLSKAVVTDNEVTTHAFKSLASITLTLKCNEKEIV